MNRSPAPNYVAPAGLLRIEDCLDEAGRIVPPDGVSLISLINRNIAAVGNATAYRYIDHSRTAEGELSELTWAQLGVRIDAIAARVATAAVRGERVAILAPQGLDYVAAFYAAVKAGTIAVPLFAPELQGHGERLETAFADARPTLVLTTTGALAAVSGFLDSLPAAARPALLTVDDIPDAAGEGFTAVAPDVDDVSHLQFTSGSTRPPVGVEITHRAVGTNLLQMILSIDLLDRNTHGVSWLPLYHDMGLSMIGFPAVYGGHSTLMSPTAFIRRPLRWIHALSEASRTGRVVTAAPNFAYEWTAARGRPPAGDDVDLANVVMIIGSEPVSWSAIQTFQAAFTPHGLAETAIKPSYGIADATLFVATIAPSARPSVLYVDREELAHGRVRRVDADAPNAVEHVACGQVARSLSAVVVDREAADELPDGRVGEIWLHGDNVGRGYWARPTETAATFGAELRRRLADGGHADGAPTDATWLRTGDLGFYLDGELYVTGRIADAVVIDGRTIYPDDVEVSAAQASPLVRRGYAAVFAASADTEPTDSVVIVAERAGGRVKHDPRSAASAVTNLVGERHGVRVSDVVFVPAGSIPRTTSGKLARRVCRSTYLDGGFDQSRL